MRIEFSWKKMAKKRSTNKYRANLIAMSCEQILISLKTLNEWHHQFIALEAYFSNDRAHTNTRTVSSNKRKNIRLNLHSLFLPLCVSMFLRVFFLKKITYFWHFVILNAFYFLDLLLGSILNCACVFSCVYLDKHHVPSLSANEQQQQPK